MVSLDTTRNPKVHSPQAQGLGSGIQHERHEIYPSCSFPPGKVPLRSSSNVQTLALSRLAPVIYEEAHELVSQLRKRENKPLDISAWLEYYTFDLMGRFGLATQFSNLSRGRPHPILSIYHTAHKRLGPLGAVPWVKHLMMGVPFIERMKYYRQFINWAADELERNIKVRLICRSGACVKGR